MWQEMLERLLNGTDRKRKQIRPVREGTGCREYVSGAQKIVSGTKVALRQFGRWHLRTAIVNVSLRPYKAGCCTALITRDTCRH